MINLSHLNDEQRRAAMALHGPVLILAGAGTGKTSTLTYRIANMVINHKINPKHILGISFTNKAATELRERVAKLIGKKLADQMTLSTFHSLGVKILKKEIQHLGYASQFSIYDSNDQLSLLKQILKSYNDEKKFDVSRLQSKISFLKNKGIDEAKFSDSPYFDADSPYDMATEFLYREYQNKLLFFNAIDFDDILFLTVKLFNQFPEVAKKYGELFQYIMIDEYQDTNPLQFDLIKALTKGHKNLCVVGDDDQSIYGFRGADIKNILEFEKYYPDAQIIKLEENYRSTTPILLLANAIIKENNGRRDKTLRGNNNSDTLPLLWSMADPRHEAQVVTEKIEELIKKKGVDPEEIAILYRSNNLAPIIEEELQLAAIDYRMLGGQKFYEKKVIKDLLAYLSVLRNPSNEISLRRILNLPARGIGLKTLEKYVSFSKEKNFSLFKSMENLGPSDNKSIASFVSLINELKLDSRTCTVSQMIKNLIDKIDYKSYIENYYKDNPTHIEFRKKDIEFFIQSAERFENRPEGDNSINAFLEKLLLEDNQENKDKTVEDNRPKLTMMTLHSSKGLEFEHVFLVGIEEEILPHKRTILEGDGISEERRLAYVGVTRAKKGLIMTYCKERELYGKKICKGKSRFINHLTDKNLFKEEDRTCFSHMSADEEKDYKKNFFQGLIESLDD